MGYGPTISIPYSGLSYFAEYPLDLSEDMSRVIEYPVPPDAPHPERPKGVNYCVEWRMGLELLRLGLALAKLASLPRGSKALVLLIPGWKAPQGSMSPLKLFLQFCGYDARHWGLGTNRGNPEAASEKLAETVGQLAKKGGRPVSLVGWSLGGVVARETARLFPEHVAGIVTYGTPVVGGPTYTIAASRWGKKGCERIAQGIRERDEHSPIRVPIAAIFSRKDEVVSWPACIDRTSRSVIHFEVSSPHIAMGIDPGVWNIILHQLHIFSKPWR